MWVVRYTNIFSFGLTNCLVFAQRAAFFFALFFFSLLILSPTPFYKMTRERLRPIFTIFSFFFFKFGDILNVCFSLCPDKKKNYLFGGYSGGHSRVATLIQPTWKTKDLSKGNFFLSGVLISS